MTKKRSKRFARKKGNRWVSNVKRDSMKACRRKWGVGQAK